MAAIRELCGEPLVFYVLHNGGDAARLFGSDGVADESALKRAYKSVALRLHPDKNPHARADEAFQVMQCCFETTLEALRSATRNGATTPPPPPQKEKQQGKHGSWAEAPAPSSSSSSLRQAPYAEPSSSCEFKKPPFPPNYRRQGERQEQQRVFLADDMFFEIPLPPDVFNEDSFQGDFASCGAWGATDISSKAKPLPKRDLQLPALDIDECTSGSGSDDEGGVSGALRRDAGRRRVAGAGGRRRVPLGCKGTQEQKLNASRQSLLQLFAQFNISDVEDETAPVRMDFSTKKNDRKIASAALNERNKGSHLKGTKTAPIATAGKSTATVACPSCGSGDFLLAATSGVVCPVCRWRFVPATVGIMSAESRAATGRKKKNMSSYELCACGKAKKGLCFLCDYGA